MRVCGVPLYSCILFGSFVLFSIYINIAFTDQKKNVITVAH